MGAWIETKSPSLMWGSVKSHPTWVRGLKLKFLMTAYELYYVASYMGAWIET